jgi:hypothetical protein
VATMRYDPCNYDPNLVHRLCKSARFIPRRFEALTSAASAEQRGITRTLPPTSLKFFLVEKPGGLALQASTAYGLGSRTAFSGSNGTACDPINL